MPNLTHITLDDVTLEILRGMMKALMLDKAVGYQHRAALFLNLLTNAESTKKGEHQNVHVLRTPN